MIEFPCRCGNLFRLPDEEGGSSVQCPACGLLTDVPLVGELHTLSEDGTYNLEERPDEPPQRGRGLLELAETFGSEQKAEDRPRLDLRRTAEELASVGAPVPTKPAAPRYDPETGELIRPIELNEPVRNLPVDAPIPFAQPAVTYRTVAAAAYDSWLGTVSLLSMPVNIAVMIMVLGVQLFAFMACVFSIPTGIIIVTIGTFIAQVLIIAHYGNVIEESGVEGRDELPRLLRDLQWHEDIWSPLRGMVLGILICYTPSFVCLLAAFLSRSAFLTTCDVLLVLAWIVGVCLIMISAFGEGRSNIDWASQVVVPLFAVVLASIACFVPAGICVAIDARTPVRVALAAVLAVPGTFLLPGVLLTLLTSGSVINLRPDRLLKTIHLCGGRYTAPLLAWMLALAAYALGQTMIAMGVLRLIDDNWQPTNTWLDRATFGYPLFCAGLILMHFFCFELGMLYRMHHATFPWVLQRHEPVNRKRPAPAVRSANNARAPRMLKK